jgi:hypothetical protein
MMNHTNHDSPDANDSEEPVPHFGAPVANELDWIESQLTRLEQDQLEVLRLLVEPSTRPDDIVVFFRDREARSEAQVSEAPAARPGRAKRLRQFLNDVAEVAGPTCLVIFAIAIVVMTFDAIHRVPALVAKLTHAPTSNPTASP